MKPTKTVKKEGRRRVGAVIEEVNLIKVLCAYRNATTKSLCTINTSEFKKK
jgi:hypothetical protein